MTTRGTRNESNRIDSNRELECSTVGSLYDRAESNRSVFADNVALPAARPVSPDCRARSSKPAAATGWDGRTNGRRSDAVASPRGGLGCTLSTPLLLEVAPDIDRSLQIRRVFTWGEVRVGSVRLRFGLDSPVGSNRCALAMSVHHTYFHLATPLIRLAAWRSG